MKIESAIWEDGWLKLKAYDVDARHFAYAFTPGEYEIKQKNTRSLDANAYAWVLIGKLAEAVGLPRLEVYRDAVRNVGGNISTGCFAAADVPKIRAAWEVNRLGRQTEIIASKLPGCVNIIFYEGSSEFDSQTMSRLIDNLVQDCKAVGIETMPPDKLAALLGEWEGKHEKNLKPTR